MSRGKFSSPAEVIMMAVGEILHRADDAVIDFDNKACNKLDDLVQDIAHYARDCAEKARNVERITIDYPGPGESSSS